MMERLILVLILIPFNLLGQTVEFEKYNFPNEFDLCVNSINIDLSFYKRNLSLVEIILKEEKGIIDSMNNLGSSLDESKIYNKLKTKRKELCEGCIPFLKSLSLSTKERKGIDLLIKWYAQLGMMKEFREFKEQLMN